MINSIDLTKCTGCGTCFKSCSLDVFRIDTQQQSNAPCMASCPAGTDIRGYNALLQQGKVDEALALLRRANPFPAITGRVCPHPCEQKCARAAVDFPVNINAIEEYLGGISLQDALPPAKTRHLAPIAIIGSGPAGLSCAWYLTELGYAVTIFEAQPQAGGMLRYGIPAYRLPVEIVDTYIQQLREAGVAIQCNTTVGTHGDISIGTLRRRRFKAVLVATGASLSHTLPLQGMDHAGVRQGLQFLHDVRCGLITAMNGDVLVVGGGDVAMDAAITAKHLGAASVRIVARTQEADLRALPHNIADAHREGIIFSCGWSPRAIRAKHGQLTLEICPCTSKQDASGQFSAVCHEEQTECLTAAQIIFATGQRVDTKLFADELAATAQGHYAAMPDAAASSGIFAAGDAVTGPATVIHAIAGGREAAFSIHRFLRGSYVHVRKKERSLVSNLPHDGIAAIPRNERVDGTLPFDTHALLAESMRCMTCGSKAKIAYSDDCMTCFTCEVRCPSGAIDVHPFKEVLPRTLEIACEE